MRLLDNLDPKNRLSKQYVSQIFVLIDLCTLPRPLCSCAPLPQHVIFRWCFSILTFSKCSIFIGCCCFHQICFKHRESNQENWPLLFYCQHGCFYAPLTFFVLRLIRPLSSVHRKWVKSKKAWKYHSVILRLVVCSTIDSHFRPYHIPKKYQKRNAS